MIQKKKIIKNTTAGITLIALVITIIVLLILAGVSISLLVGENGILEQTQNAKLRHEEASIEEEIKLAVGASYKEDGKINITKLNEHLKNLGIEDNVESLPKDIYIEDYKITIQEDGNVSTFNIVEWDKIATPEDCFQWGSNVEGEDGYNVITGYTAKLESYTKVRIPSRCKRIVCDDIISGKNETNGRAFFSNVQKVEIPETVIEIGKYAFGSEYGITSVLQEAIIPSSVTSIGYGAFLNCTKLNNIIIPDSVTNIGENAFKNCTNLKSIVIPDSIISVGSSAFNNTKWYNEQPDGLVYIGKVLYKYKGTMPENTNIKIKDGTTEIGVGAFYGCNTLTNIVIPESVITIQEHAFSSCESLASIVIPASVINIKFGVFMGWTSEQVIKCRPTTQPEGWLMGGWDGSPTIIWGYTGE